MTFPMTIVDTIFKAVAPAIPDRVAAGHHADLIIAQFIGFSNNQFIFAGLSHAGGGWGAKKTEDGVSATIAMNDGDTHNSPIELLEVKYPLFAERYELVPDSGGAGKYRGGLGVDREVQPLIELKFTSHIERSQCKPWGLFGGGDAMANALFLRKDGKNLGDLPNAKAFTLSLKLGDSATIRGGGGGGYGDPTEREPEKVREDVYQGYVTLGAARDTYGVVLDAETLTVDAAATKTRRDEIRASAK
jgi:N-methylhydantoinase B